MTIVKLKQPSRARKLLRWLTRFSASKRSKDAGEVQEPTLLRPTQDVENFDVQSVQYNPRRHR